MVVAFAGENSFLLGRELAERTSAFVAMQGDMALEVICRERDITITAPSAALASTLRYHVRHLQKIADTKKTHCLQDPLITVWRFGSAFRNQGIGGQRDYVSQKHSP